MNSKKNKFLKKYFEDYVTFLRSSQDLNFRKLIQVSEILKKTNEKGNKIIICGNGGSSAIASHFSVDITKNAKVRCINFNEADLITCFSNDYGYEEWIAKSIDFYGDKGDVLIAISTSGKSKNIINGCLAAKKKKFSKIVTFSGNKKNNPLMKHGDINFWVNSAAYNQVETIHQLWLLAIIDLIIGKAIYPSN
jgi:D-sedoheptulose 7-phosphate isomerase